MKPNPVLKKLGFSDTDRVVIIHADDIGMCQATLTAYSDLMDFGLVSSAATMVPCGWFPATAAYCRAHPEVDMGVHTTITCEWDTYRWGPLTGSHASSGMVDEEGYFWRSSRAVQEHGQPEAVHAELEAQIQRAIDAGINPTHIDTHMGAVAHEKFMGAYIQSGIAYGLPPLNVRWDADTFKRQRGMDDVSAQAAEQAVLKLEEQGIPLIDHFAGMPLSGDKPLELAQEKFDALQPGITHFVLHPAQDTPELRAIAPDWPARVADYELFTSAALRDYVQQQGIQVIGYRALQALMPNR